MRAHFVAGACVVLSTFGCGGDDASEQDASCASPQGDYTLTFWPRSGTCELPNAVIAPGGEVPITGCAGGSETWSDDGCTAQYTGRCPASAPYAEAEWDITVRWSQDATEASGDASLTAYDSDGNVACSSTYTIRMSPYVGS